jgi:hypothetical protein
MSRFWIVSLWLVVIIIANGLAQTTALPSEAEVCTDEDYAIFAAALSDSDARQRVGGVILLDHTATGFPPGLAAVTQLGGKAQAFFKEVPKEAKDDFDARNKNRAKIEAGKIKAPFETLSISDDDAKKLVEGKGGWQAFHEKYPSMHDFKVISRPGINREHSRAVLYVGVSCGPLCGGGSLLFLSKETGEWKVINTVTIWLS